MTEAPKFTDVRVPKDPRAIVLVLHGGAEHGPGPVGIRSLSWRRGRVLARHLAPALKADGIGILLLRYRVKGWNARPGALPDPVQDARWALDEIRSRYDLPVVILGHSMGARTAVAVADDPAVLGVVALAPWFPKDEPVEALAGKVLHAAHGTRDHITSPKATMRYVERAGVVAAEASFVDMGPVGHYLLRQSGLWNLVALSGVQKILNDA
ncbi:alpha/beta hydrolase [Nocardioides sp. CPCC 206347]|uniref:alpha/beta hydrolase n=1 Tax=unclassified Nocardioides TaxID=2615069 RepID=UPI0036111C30